MLSFKNVESYDDGIIDDDEFVLLFDFNTSKKARVSVFGI